MPARAHDRHWEVKYAPFTAAFVSLCRIVSLIVYWTGRAREAVAFVTRLCDHGEDERIDYACSLSWRCSNRAIEVGRHSIFTYVLLPTYVTLTINVVCDKLQTATTWNRVRRKKHDTVLLATYLVGIGIGVCLKLCL